MIKPALHTLLLSTLLLCLAVSVYAETTVSFRKHAAVNTSKVLLADIADISPVSASKDVGQISVGAAPQLGRVKTFEVAVLLASLQNNPLARGVHWQGSPQVEVLRQTTRIKKAQLISMVNNYLEDNRESLPPGTVRFTPRRVPEEVLVPRGKLSWKIKPSRSELVKSSNFSIYFQVDGKPAQNCTVRGTLQIMHPVAVALTTITRGQPIAGSVISFVERDITKLRNPIFARQEVVGMLAKRTLRKGRAIEHDHIAFPPVIAEGELVKILAIKGNLKITANGIAKTSGKTGEVIRVQNITSNKLIYARIDAPGIVSVEF
ncbi:MAG: flagella basal body P-ring formation protein FlgA [Desulfobulbus propionicus]|nr:MAG: flagella basal body P-ring formation protein FlgA [Desulfobulbus propionicus]